jgi:hypothetical protein
MTENPATVEELREALQFAIAELFEAGDKLWVSHCNHPGDYGIENKDSLSAIHRREDRERLADWSDRIFKATDEIRKVLAK